MVTRMTLKPYHFSLVAVLGALAFAHPAPAHAATGIAAVVNEDAISDYDVDKRVRFVIATTKLANTPEVVSRIRPQVITALINERLQLQEAKKNDIKISEDDIKKATASIEQERGMDAGAITAMLDKNGVPPDTFAEQLRAQLAWNKLLGKNVRPRVHISDEEVALAQKNYTAPIEVQEVQIGILLLPVDKASRDAEVHKFADKMVNETHRGANFEELARQFRGGAGDKIDKFWVRPENLDPMIAHALGNARAGMVVGPLHNREGYTLIKVYDVRARDDGPAEANSNPTIKAKEILFKLKNDATEREANAMIAIAQEVAKNPGTCADKGVPGIADMKDMDTEVNFLQGKASELQPAVRAILTSMRVGAMSEPFASREGIRMYMLCDSQKTQTGNISRDDVYPVIMQQKMGLEAQKYMRNLRRAAFIDVRDGSEKKG